MLRKTAFQSCCCTSATTLLGAPKSEDPIANFSPRWIHVRYVSQACFNAARALNVRGAGVQVRRNKCFEKACQALWPGGDTVDGDIAAGFSSDNVVSLSDAEEGDDEEFAGAEG